jgi:hypothetical protein
MQRYKFPTSIHKWTEEGYELIHACVIRYKCSLCEYTHDYDDTWTDAKKAEVQAEMDAHHADHLNITS